MDSLTNFVDFGEYPYTQLVPTVDRSSYKTQDTKPFKRRDLEYNTYIALYTQNPIDDIQKKLNTIINSMSSLSNKNVLI